jgi:hypothetical protein
MKDAMASQIAKHFKLKQWAKGDFFVNQGKVDNEISIP